MTTKTESYEINLDRMAFWSEQRVSPRSIGRMVAVIGQLVTDRVVEVFHRNAFPAEVTTQPFYTNSEATKGARFAGRIATVPFHFEQDANIPNERIPEEARLSAE